jgi:Calpain family cysteine protease
MRFSIGMALVLVGTVAVAQAKTPPGPRFADVVHEHFEAWDLNHNGKLEAKEIDTLMRKQSIQGDAAAALAVLKLRERRTPPSIRPKFRVTSENVDDLDSMEDDNSAIDPSHAAKPFRTEPQFRRYRKTLETMIPRLYAGDGPDFSVMKQGNIGDCFFFCMTGYLASHHPDRIRRMIEEGPDGNYVVKFLDGETFTVRAPTMTEVLVNNSSSSVTDGVWLSVLEEALGKRLRKKSKDPNIHTAEPADAIASGGSSATVITLYSGHKAKSFKLRGKQASFRLNELRHELSVALSHGRMVGLSMDPAPNEKAKIPGLGYHHAYAIMDFDEKEDRVTIWNPWGSDFHPKGPEGHENGYAREHGIFHLPLKTMYHLFACVDVETTERATSDSSNRNTQHRSASHSVHRTDRSR